MSGNCLRLDLDHPARFRDIPSFSPDAMLHCVGDALESGRRLAALFGARQPSGSLDLMAVLANDGEKCLEVARTDISDGIFPSLTPSCPQAHLFEREIAEQFGVLPEGHPWLKPVRFSRPLHDFGKGPAWTRAVSPAGVYQTYRTEGEEVHEVAVGPVHAGVIEPGHFRFQCHGETVMHLEISLGYQHRGVERGLMGGPDVRTLPVMETVAGDTTIGHAWAYCQALECLGGRKPGPRQGMLRAVLLELERMANHTGDLGALSGDVGFLPTLSYCGRLRGDVLNLSALFCGSRFGRGMVVPGGVAFDADLERLLLFRDRLEAVFSDIRGAVELLFHAASVCTRFETTGVVPAKVARDLGLVGPAARASGLDLDLRQDFATGGYQVVPIEVAVEEGGDVMARAVVRWREIQNSYAFLVQAVDFLVREQESAACEPVTELASDCLAVSLVEGWRGQICHVALTDQAGRFSRYKIVDPSFHNWTGLAMALRDQQISDFPLCNKSFNLSYCGFDL